MLSKPKTLRLNVGCGEDYREGWINIDGSPHVKCDIVHELPAPLCGKIEPGIVRQIAAFDVLEHLYRWQAIAVLKDFYALLCADGRLTVQVPDCAAVIACKFLSPREKIRRLYGAQDERLGRMDESRDERPDFFCHKFGWTRNSMAAMLANVGFKINTSRRVAGPGFVFRVTAIKPGKEKPDGEPHQSSVGLVVGPDDEVCAPQAQGGTAGAAHTPQGGEVKP